MTTLPVAVLAVQMATPSIADPHPDAVLLELGCAFDVQSRLVDELLDRGNRVEQAAKVIADSAPEALRWRWRYRRNEPLMFGRRFDGQIYSDDEVDQIRAHRCHGREGQARADEIVCAWTEWAPRRDAYLAELDLTAAYAEYDAALQRLDALALSVEKASALTIEGKRMQAHVIHAFARRDIEGTELQHEPIVERLLTALLKCAAQENAA